MTSEKLQKVLARAGFGSRRELEEWIAAGRISINGKRASLGDRVGERDVIRVDGHVVQRARLVPRRRRVLIYHKPVGEVCTRSDPEGRPTIFASLPRIANGRWVAVGRLDLNTSGLLLITNDGELANRLMHPSSEIEREYAVRVLGTVPPETLERLRTGVLLDDGEAKFDSIVDGGGEGANHWYNVTLREGRNREVRRLWESQGIAVSRLMRVRYGNVVLARSIRPGRFDDLEGHALEGLLALVGMQSAPARPARRAKKTSEGVGARRASAKQRDQAPAERAPRRTLALRARSTPSESAPRTKKTTPARTGGPTRRRRREE